jgi:hypothetical protein
VGGDNLTSVSPACVFSLQPTKWGTINQKVTINSNAYNSGTPQINLTGTGAANAQANVAAHALSLHANRVGRKSFAAAKFK